MEFSVGTPGRTVKVSDVATLTNDSGPASIDRYNRQRQISVNANLQGVPLSEVLAAARIKVDELHLKPGYQAVFGGSARTLSEASNNFTIAIILAVLFIYMVLASQFNSFVHPLTIMTSLPLSLPAGLLSLMAFGMTLNVYSAIGMMMLFGIVKKNSILQVDYTNTLREQGMGRHDAMIAANHVRLRPILMTTISIVAGMIPIALGRGAGAGSRASMALTIIGGQALCLLLTHHTGGLFVLRRSAGTEAVRSPAPTGCEDQATEAGGGVGREIPSLVGNIPSPTAAVISRTEENCDFSSDAVTLFAGMAVAL
jgi:HAE1 family hydrophobic/amphiphilic exporter-1